MKEKVQRVNVIVSGLLEMQAVGANLFLGLLDNEIPTSFPPPPRGNKLRAQRAHEKQRHRFAQKMGIGSEVSGQIAHDVPSVQRLRGPEFRREGMV